ncbi:hypothetical protein AYO49_03210 [Verrucomicrobiaceae bacterium SCGC AG-212-N21]|nr:hypothetical protein AYO49_03210 [Verrucomicrobiaceae bacterium SCGC AG-212-N21]
MNLYEQFIRDTLAGKHTRVRPRIRVCRQTLDLTAQGSYEDYWHRADRDLPRGLLPYLIEASRNPTDLSSHFILNPRADHAQSTALELLGEHYSSLPLKHDSDIEFSFSPIVVSDSVSLFYGSFDRGFLWAAGLLCIATDTAPTLQTRCLWRS